MVRALSCSMILVIIVFSSYFAKSQSKHSCSTIMFENANTIVIAHNLDDYIDVPGMIMINKRNVTKKNINWERFN